MKKCYKCLKEKELTEFNKNKKRKDGLQAECRDCNKIKANSYYQNNKKKIIKENCKRRKELSQDNRKFLFDFYKEHPCVDCGENDPLVLEMDHLSNKKIGISRAVHRGWSKISLIEEMNKCEVRCANCHRRKTAKDQKWFKFLELEKVSSTKQQTEN